MTLNEFRSALLDYRREVEAEATSTRNSQMVLDRLNALYESFDAQKRQMANSVMAEWALDDDENVRFDGEALIDTWAIREGIPALRQLAGRLETSDQPGAPFELRKVLQILERLCDAC
jgi:hypothetical protein